MRKIANNVENQIIEMTNNDASAQEIAKAGICHRTALQVSKKRNINAYATTRSSSRLLTAMQRLMIAKPKPTPTEVAIAIGKPVSEWIARRAHHRISPRARKMLQSCCW